jgi:DNA gyrase subunit A
LAKKGGRKTPKQDGSSADSDQIRYVSISEETRRRYLNYALSVITSRALPDVRDGLKPVQRRIMYVMHSLLRLTADSKTRKCAKICGDTTGNFHPHGDTAVYDALVRMAQDFTLREPLITGQGNFGSIIGLKAAASRYTEAKLTPIAEQLMRELRFDTVEMRPNYDATNSEPVVLPARYPNLLVNGTQGIAVGMATNIPPHNLGEVVRAAVHLIDNPTATVVQLMKFIKGPDFPMGGRLITNRKDLTDAYKNGRGTIKIRGEWRFDRDYKGQKDDSLVIYSVPYGVSTGPLLAEIGDLVESRKIPQLVAVNDETNETNGLRLVLETGPGADPDAVMAYLYRHTSLESSFSYNMTALVPEDGAMVPRVLSLTEMLQHFLDFRFITVKRRYEYQLRQLEKRIHILEGYVIVFNGLDKALRIIRNSRGKQDACTKLMKEFPLDEVQTTAVLDLALYRISSLEINTIKEELREKQVEADRIRRLLKSDKRLWKCVQTELREVADEFDDKRRTGIGSADEVTEFDASAYIVRENTNVVFTRDGWIKRVGRLAKIETTRVRDGDKVMDVVPANTLDRVVFFSSDGVAYTLPVDQIPASSGYGDPLSKYARTSDGAQIIAAVSTDERFTYVDEKVKGNPTPWPYMLIVTANGQVMQVSFSTFRQPSTKAGRKYCRLRKGDRVAFVEMIDEEAQTMFIASKKARVIHFDIDDVPLLTNPGIGVRGLKVEASDEVIGARQLCRPGDCLRVINTNGKTLSFGQMKYGVTSRGGKGIKTSHRSGFAEIIRPEIRLVDWSELEDD